MNRKTNDEYKKEVVEKYGDIFDFSETFYSGRRGKITIKYVKQGRM